MSQDLASIPVVALDQTAADRISIAATDGFTFLEGADSRHGRLISPDVYLRTLMDQDPHALAGVGRVMTVEAMATGGAAVGMAALAFTPVGPLIAAAWVASCIGGPKLTQVISCNILILNRSSGNLTFGQAFQNHGTQTAQPVIGDPNTGTKNYIPAVRVAKHANGTQDRHYSLGVYRFENDLSAGISFYGTGGAVSFTSDDPAAKGKTFAFSWMVKVSGDPGFGVTTDLVSKYGNLKDFYLNTADKGNHDRYDSGVVKIEAQLGVQRADVQMVDGARAPGQPDLDTKQLTIMITVS